MSTLVARTRRSDDEHDNPGEASADDQHHNNADGTRPA
jgi:hypothetical protein